MSAIDGLTSKLIQTFDRFDTVENKVEESQVAVKDAEGFARKRLLTKDLENHKRKVHHDPRDFQCTRCSFINCLEIYQNIVFIFPTVQYRSKSFFSSQAIVPRL